MKEAIDFLNGFVRMVLVYVDGVSCPKLTIVDADGASQPNPDATTWLRIDQLVLRWINSSLSDGPLSQVINSESSHDAWTVLETLYGSHTRDRIHQIKGELQTLTKDTFSLEDYLHKAKAKLSSFTRGSRTSGHGRGNITCFRCGDPNHKADGCFAFDEEAEQYKAFAAIQIGDITEDTWYPDTGANQHMTPNSNEVQGIHPYSGTDTIMVGNGNGLSITGIGQTTLPITTLQLHNVLVVPNIKGKLLFVSQFIRDNNCYFLFYPWGFLLKDMKTNQVILKGPVVNGLFPINL
uniref:Retrovirus-related Pol polyprotein from transposon TNT 1-94-like beta-barrel domain-containing protein n=1 Tax=Populus alba TaxID=43335 RepID=A0A4U5QBY4_POPAL|nr:hypothetical protein D5086_0000105980 [Populus alba]